MNVHDWALVTFTLLSQMSIGAFVVLGIIHTYAIRKAGMQEADRLSDRGLLAIIPVMVLGLAASLTHLGSPLVAYNAVNNLATSWLSREVLSGLLFAGFGFVFVILQWRKIFSFTVRNIIAWIAALIGLGMVYMMSHIYMQPTVPGWDSFMTMAYFYSTTLLLGSLAMGTAFVINYTYVKRKYPESEAAQTNLLLTSMRAIAIAAILLLGIEFIIIPLYLAYMGSSPVSSIVTALYIKANGVIFGFRLALIFIGAGVLTLFLYRNAINQERERIMAGLTYSAFILVFASEVLGRFLFYASYFRIGL
jgi:anaerobic dimethyl sulfoxide reductase subunit C (anchor subunit)